jgi:lactate permease
MGQAFPLASPLVGILGAFATGSNTNSNVLFGPMQKSIAGLLGVAPAVLLAAQTAGGSLGSMIAPAKLIVGCSTVGLAGRDGEVLRITLPYGALIGLALGVVTWLAVNFGF